MGGLEAWASSKGRELPRAKRQPKEPQSPQPRGFVLPEPCAVLTPGDLASPTQTTSLSPGTAHRCTSGDSVRLFFFFQFSLICPCGLEQNLTLNLSVLFHPLCHLLKCLSGTLLKATLRACTRIANKAADMQVPSRNRFFTCFYHLLKNALHNSGVVVRYRSHANCCCSE